MAYVSAMKKQRHRALRFSSAAKYLLFIMGMISTLVMLHYAGWPQMISESKRIGWGFIPYLILHVIKEAMETAAWQLSIPGHEKYPWKKLFLVHWVGTSIHHISHAGLLGSGTAKVVMVRNQVSTQYGIASILVSTLADAIGLILFISGGMVLLLNTSEVPGSLKTALSLGFGCLTMSIIIFWRFQCTGLPGWIGHVLEKIPRVSALQAQLMRGTSAVIESVRVYHHQEKRRFWTAVAVYFVRRFLNILQVYLLLFYLGVPGGLRYSFLVGVFSDLIDALFFFVPGRIGAHEGGRLLISKALGMTTAQGLTLGMVSRMVQIIWAAWGFILLTFWKGISPPMNLLMEREAVEEKS